MTGKLEKNKKKKGGIDGGVEKNASTKNKNSCK